jgi:hypothetical protein
MSCGECEEEEEEDILSLSFDPFRYPRIKFTDNPFVFYFNIILFQWLPSLLIDMLLVMTGRKPV